MEQTALYKLIKKAREENKAVQLVPFDSDRNNLDIIIEPQDEICNDKSNIIRCNDCLIDLSFIVTAQIIPNRRDRVSENERISMNSYRSNPRGRRN